MSDIVYTRVTGGTVVGPDGRAHPTFLHNPSTLRLSCIDPNLTNQPRGTDEVSKWVKEMYVAPKGKIFWARDFSGIEAVLVGYYAGAKGYTRLAKMDVHSFYTAYALNTLDGRVKSQDLPSIEWDDDKLRKRLAEIKIEFKQERNDLYKHLVHGANFFQTPHGAQSKIFKDTGKAFDIKLIQKVMGVYFDLFPEIKIWHRDLCDRVDGTKKVEIEKGDTPDPWTMGVCYVKNPFGYVHRFYDVKSWEKINDEWYGSFGPDAARCIAFLPQSTAAAIIKKSAKSLWYDYPWIGSTIRLLIHDEILGECDEGELENCLKISQQVMEKPLEELPLNPDWGMGEFLSIGTEPKVGKSWASMK